MNNLIFINIVLLEKEFQFNLHQCELRIYVDKLSII